MKRSHLTLRLSPDLARALDRWARAQGVPKSQLVREAVARYLAPPPPAAPVPEDLRRRALEAAGKYASGRSDIAQRHDDYLADDYRS